jgi:hypothetical protein
MQQKKTDKQTHLQQLEELIKLDYVGDKEHHHFMRSVGNQYPFEFVRFMMKHRADKPRKDKDLLDQCFPFALAMVKGMSLKFWKYLICPPRSEREQEEFEYISEKLEEMILKQARDN